MNHEIRKLIEDARDLLYRIRGDDFSLIQEIDEWMERAGTLVGADEVEDSIDGMPRKAARKKHVGGNNGKS